MHGIASLSVAMVALSRLTIRWASAALRSFDGTGAAEDEAQAAAKLIAAMPAHAATRASCTSRG